MTILLVILCWVGAAIFEAIKDTLAFKFKTSIFRNFNPDWWNPSISWRNKYREGRPFLGARFPGSTHVLSLVTDAWHLCQWLTIASVLTSIALVVYDNSLSMQPIALMVLIVCLILLRMSLYRLFYNNILRKKK